MVKQESKTPHNTKASKESTKENKTSPTRDPRTAHKEDQITNTEEQKEIINEPNYKTDREEEITNITPEKNGSAENLEADKKELPEAEA